MDPLRNIQIGFIGAGHMAFALANGMISQGVIKAEKVWASAPTMNNLSKFQSLNCVISHNNCKVVMNCSIIVLCTKPHQVVNVMNELSNTWTDGQTLISVLAGVTLQTLKELLPPKNNVQLIRATPNIPMSVQAGVIVYSCEPDVDGSIIEKLFGPIAICQELAEELINAAGGLSGCGPAFIFTIIEGLSDGGVKMGLPKNISTLLAAQTVMGSAKMVLQLGKHPAVLKDEVCFPAGTTISGIHALEKAGIRAAMMNAIEASTLRASELGKAAVQDKKGS